MVKDNYAPGTIRFWDATKEKYIVLKVDSFSLDFDASKIIYSAPPAIKFTVTYTKEEAELMLKWFRENWRMK